MKHTYHTNRLILNTVSPEYSPVILDFLLNNKECFEKYETVKNNLYYTDAFQYSTILAENSLFDSNEFLRYYVFLDDLSYPIGTVSFKKTGHQKPDVLRLGYKFDYNYRNKGYAFEAISFLVNMVFEENAADRIDAVVVPDNEASVHILKKCGFSRLEGADTYFRLPCGMTLHHTYLLSHQIGGTHGKLD